MFYLGRLISAFFNQLFRWLFWNKTGQKVLFTIVIFAIAVCFIKLGEVSAVEEVSDINYEVRSYYDGVVNLGLLRLDNFLKNNPNSEVALNLKSGVFNVYFYGGNLDGSSYNNARPLNLNIINVCFYNVNSNYLLNITNYDYLGVTGYPIYTIPNSLACYQLYSTGNVVSSQAVQNFNMPLWVLSYQNARFNEYLVAYRNGDTQTIIQLLNDIESDLSNTTPNQESEDFIVVDSSASDNVDTSEIDSVFSSAFSSFANKFTYYDLSDADQWVITINGTRIVLRSNILYNMIKDTWFYPMLQLLWYYIFGHYAFVWLTNLIHKIKDGSILDGLEVNEVISKEML